MSGPRTAAASSRYLITPAESQATTICSVSRTEPGGRALSCAQLIVGTLNWTFAGRIATCSPVSLLNGSRVLSSSGSADRLAGPVSRRAASSASCPTMSMTCWRSSSSVATSPPGDGSGPGEADGTGDAGGVAAAVGLAPAAGLPLALGPGVASALASGLGVGPGLPLAPGLADGDGVGFGITVPAPLVV